MNPKEEIDTLAKGAQIWRALAEKRDKALKEILNIIKPVDSQFVTKELANEEIIKMVRTKLSDNGYRYE